MIDALSEVKKLGGNGAKAMSMLRFVRGRGKLAWAFVVLALLFSAPSAHAATYLYTFSAATLLTQLQAQDPVYSESVYFAIFLQPPSAIGTYSYGTEVSPKPAGTGVADDWQATLASPDALHPTNYVEFAKENTQSTVTVLAASSVWSWSNISPNVSFNGLNYVNGGAAPGGWNQSSGATIDSDTFAQNFSFTLTNVTTGPGPFTFNGLASEIQSSSTTTVTSTKVNTGVPFTISLTGTLVAAPEPDTIVLLGLGVALMFAGGVRKRKKKLVAG
jgi:hypothetical protein